MRPVFAAFQPSVTEEMSDLGIKISIRCASKVPGSLTTKTVLAKIDMPGYRGVKMYIIDKFDSVISERIISGIEDYK